jgi:hypothetical protein
MNDFDVLFGAMVRDLGLPADFNGFRFVPAVVRLIGNGFAHDYRLADHVGAHAPGVLWVPLHGQFEAAWVRARIPRVFGFDPEPAEVEKALLDLGFVAIPEGTDAGYPFWCSDHYGRVALLFSPEGPDRWLQARIAAAFWDLLLEEPEDLADFEEDVAWPCDATTRRFGCQDGDVFCHEVRARRRRRQPV